jgi:Tol biopolymer transport system component
VVAYHPNLGETEPEWLDRAGNRAGAAGPPGVREDIRLSPDGNRIAFARADVLTGNGDVWVNDVSRQTSSRFTFDTADDSSPVFSPDGSEIAFSSNRGGTNGIYRKPVSGAGSEASLTTSEHPISGKDWSSDGRFVLYQTSRPKTGWDLWAAPTSGDSRPFVLVETEHDEREGQFSPDVKWFAYDSSESGRREVWVQPFPPTGSRWQVSTSGGFSPRWSRDGKELFFIAANGTLTAVPVSGSKAIEFGAATPLFQTTFRDAAYGNYAVAPDGKRFLLNLPPKRQDVRPITVVLNWPGALNK